MSVNFSLMANSSLANSIAHGTKWYVAMRWCIKALGFVSSAILARLLVPEDFGLVATVLVILGLISLLFEFGVNWALIQNNKATDEDFNTAWTIRIIQVSIIAALLAVFSNTIAGLYGDPRIEETCLIIAAATFVNGFENIGTIKFQKEMNFSKDFWYNVLPKLIATGVTIGLAYYYLSYYALIMATLVNGVIKVVISYLVSDYRPTFCLKKTADIWGFSQWILLRNIANYISSKGDLIVLSLMTTPTQVGFYKWGSELSLMTISEVQHPFSRALVPGLAKIKDDHSKLIAAYLKALSAMALVAVPFSLGFGAVSEQLIPLFLGGGDKWLPVVPLIEGLVFFAMCTALYSISGNLLTIDGHVKYTAYIFWIQAIITIISLYPIYSAFGLVGIAYARGGIGLVMLFVVSAIVVKLCDVKVGYIVNAIWRPVVAGLSMYYILLYGDNLLQMSMAGLMLLKILCGGIIYIGLVLALWWLSGRPRSIETDVIGVVKSFWNRKNRLM